VSRGATLAAYRLATGLSTPLIAAWLVRRVRLGKEDPARLSERWGRASIARPPGPLLWLHGASVGESLALMSFVERAGETRPEVSILVTSGTRAAAEVLAQRLSRGAIHQYLPIDTPAASRAFVDHWRPDLGVFVESEIWPNLLLAAKAGGARLALLSARLSEASARGWARAPASAKTVFAAFDLILARDEDQAVRLAALGARDDGVIDLKFGAPPLPSDPAVIARVRALGRRPIILAASTHPGEDALVLQAFGAARRPGALLIVAPRHPERGEGIARLAAGDGFTVARRSRGEAFGASDVLVADTVGELGTWYAVADLALIGGGWTPGVGGHNPLEAARLDCPMIAGPRIDGWPVYSDLVDLGATRLVAEGDLAAAMDLAWSDPLLLASMAAAAAAFVAARDRGVVAALDRTLALLP
jgi:3-deoxy-D-manno-octulosonic-acid transferase